MPSLPVGARALRTALRDAVRACVAQDAEALSLAGADRLDAEQVRVVLGHVVRALVERAHPDGVDGDDLQTLLEDVVRGAAWLPDLSVDGLVAVLTGAFGVHPEEPAPPPPGLPVAAALVVARLLRPGEPVDPHLDAALAEVARAETVEMP